MELSLIQIFVEVMRRGSFAAVARDRGVDPSTISRSISVLEKELGVRLFQRNSRQLSPTESGTVYFDRIEPIIEEVEQARFKAVDIEGHLKGTLHIATPVSFALLNIIPLLPELGEKYPELSFNLVMTDAALDLLAERIDVAIRLGPLTDSGLVTYQLSKMVSKVCASPSYIELYGRPEKPQDLQNHQCLLLDMPGFSSTWKFRNSKGEVTGVPVQGKLTTSNAIALKECARSGMGIIMQARWIVGRELREGTLIDLFPDYEVTAAEFDSPAIWILYPSRTYLPRKVRVFVEFLKEKFQKGSPWDTAL